VKAARRFMEESKTQIWNVLNVQWVENAGLDNALLHFPAVLFSPSFSRRAFSALPFMLEYS